MLNFVACDEQVKNELLFEVVNNKLKSMSTAICIHFNCCLATKLYR